MKKSIRSVFRIVGEGSGCEAMGRRYHVHCFTCHKCGCQLQGRAFYALDGKPYCSEDYLGTLEKCCKCLKPILERILRATGKPYHPDCFRCSVCQSRLDGVPFTVDSTNHIHCIPCFHQVILIHILITISKALMLTFCSASLPNVPCARTRSCPRAGRRRPSESWPSTGASISTAIDARIARENKI